MGIGPDSGEEANRIWTHLEREKVDLDDLINNYKTTSNQLANSQLNSFVKGIRLSLREEKGGGPGNDSLRRYAPAFYL